jgi:hypothetical protein
MHPSSHCGAPVLVNLEGITFIGSMVAASAEATAPLIGAAAAKGFPAKSCQYCHVSVAVLLIPAAAAAAEQVVPPPQANRRCRTTLW